ncbi:hypothetical protein DL96DRAFT_370920 [Flagelloscypha sp. PMI_526]|nr:hypothetical protein DL96DRAFT_370920 [Flagelloscypha sp. PMI_526]
MVMASPLGGSIPVLLPSLDMTLLLSVEFKRQACGYALSIAAAFTGFAWDTLLCFPSEYKYFWKGKFTQGSLLYFLNRYFVVINLTLSVLAMLVGPSPKVRVIWLSYLAGTGAFLQATFAEAVLLRRALLFLDNTSIFKYILLGGFFVTMTAGATVAQLTVKSMTMATKTYFGTSMCTVITFEPGFVSELGFVYVPAVAFNILLAFVSIWVFTNKINGSLFKQSVGIRLISAMRWQAIAHFTLVMLLYLLNSLISHFAGCYLDAVAPLTLTLTAITSSRMIIFMQDEADQTRCVSVELEVTSSVLRDRFGMGASTNDESGLSIGATHSEWGVA